MSSNLDKGDLSAINMLGQLPSSIHKRTIGKWIPISEGMPEVGKAVLCNCQASILVILEWTDYGVWNDGESNYLREFVKEWMPLHPIDLS